jgi:hypothetical protein
MSLGPSMTSSYKPRAVGGIAIVILGAGVLWVGYQYPASAWHEWLAALAALLSVTIGGAFLLLRSDPDRLRLILLIGGLGAVWGTCWSLLGWLAYATTGSWYAVQALPYLGFLAGLTGGAFFGYVMFLRHRDAPPTPLMAIALGFAVGVIATVWWLAPLLMTGELARAAWYGDLVFLPLGAGTGALSLPLARKAGVWRLG